MTVACSSISLLCFSDFKICILQPATNSKSAKKKNETVFFLTISLSSLKRIKRLWYWNFALKPGDLNVSLSSLALQNQCSLIRKGRFFFFSVSTYSAISKRRGEGTTLLSKKVTLLYIFLSDFGYILNMLETRNKCFSWLMSHCDDRPTFHF